MDYWNSTASMTSTGKPVDAVIGPLAPWPAARPNQYAYYGYSVWVNLLDYTSVVVPITNVDKNIDKVDASYTPRSDVDKACHESCELKMVTDMCKLLIHHPDDPEIYEGAHVSLQLVGRRLQEEKMLAIGGLVHDALKK
jgi:amidase